jgi:hypothetical protein
MPYKDKEKGRVHNKAYYLANKKILSEKQRERYLKNPQKHIESSRKRYAEKTKEIKLQNHNRYLKNKNRIKKVNAIWILKNKEKVKIIKKRYRDSHKEQIKKYSIEYSKSHRNQRNKHRRQWRKNNPERVKEEKLKLRFKITLIEYNKLLEQQNNKCGICNETFDFSNLNKMKYPSVDHCHSTKKVRGILCRRCNSGIGGFHDNIDLLNRALLWLFNQITFIKINTAIQNITVIYKKSYLKKYKLTPGQFKKMVLIQNNKCGICEKDLSKVKINGSGTGPYNIDHSHTTGKIRGILCPLCNKALGLLKDNAEIIKNAIKWLEEKGTSNENS